MSLNDTTLHPSRKRNRTRVPLEVRFWKFVQKTDTCWLWTGATRNFGYGAINSGGHNGRSLPAHRVSWELHYGSIPEDSCVLHHCDVPACVRPDHLFLGTKADNVHDMYAKGRENNSPRATGESHHAAVLTEQQVIDIRTRYANEHPPYRTLSDEFGVRIATIHNIVSGNIWKHVGGPLKTSNMSIGERNNKTKLTAPDVLEIRRAFAEGSHTRPQLAAAYGVSLPTIHRIINRQVWKHI